MNVLTRQIEQERKDWAVERDRLQEGQAWYESELARLQAENSKLKIAPPNQLVTAPVFVEPSAPVQAHHEKQLKLMETIDGLRRELQSERDRSQRLEQMGGGIDETRFVCSDLDKTMACAMRPLPPKEDFERDR